MPSPFFDAAHSVLAQLEEVERAPATDADSEATTRENAEISRLRQAAIRKALDFLSDQTHPVVFIGSVGVGKSSLIGVLANLLLGPRPSTRAALKEQSVLAIGSGRTTVCEVRIRPSREEEPPLGLLVDPMPLAEFKREILLYAQDEWARKQAGSRRPAEDGVDPISQELHAAIRNMTGYAEKVESFLEGNLRRRRIVRPLDEVILNFPSASALAEHLIERVNFKQREKAAWFWDADTEENRKALKERFEAVNRGQEPSAMLPQRMTVVVPHSVPESASGLEITIIDSRGLDGPVALRRDLRELLADRRAVPVLCGSFKDAPDDTVREALRAFVGDIELERVLPNLMLLLVDQGDAEQVNGADGDREAGQQLKLDECYDVLDKVGLSKNVGRSRLLAFDALNDDRTRLVAAVDERLAGLRKAAEDELDAQCEEAKRFIAGASNQLVPVLRRKVDQAIIKILRENPIVGVPLQDPLEGMYEVIRERRSGPVVYAACRRNGSYVSLNLDLALLRKAADTAETLIEHVIELVLEDIDTALRDPFYELAWDHLLLRRKQFLAGYEDFALDYAHRVCDQVQERLDNNPVWEDCCNEWGEGPGFKDRVINHLKNWSAQQQGLTEHQKIDPAAFIPLLKEATPLNQAPQFTIHVRNLRALRQVDFQAEQVNVLIGANGTGKTTLLETLRLLRLAYERGLSQAVNIVLHGASNLKTWGVTDEEPIQIGVDLGDLRWRIELLTREGSVADKTNETLTYRGEEVFTRDSLGNFVYRKERIESGSLTVLKTLVDRGVHEPAVRQMAAFLEKLHVYRDPDLVSLREGSRMTEDRQLQTRGGNALALLRRWYTERNNRHRYQFVLEGLDAAFPNKVSDMDFVSAGNTVVVNVYRPNIETPSALQDEANGLLQLLVLLCDIAAAEEESVVAIDEPENGLHPYALRAFLRRATLWARKYNVTVLLATHSIVLLDELNAHPEQVYVMKAKESGGPVPTRLDKLYDRTWLSEFQLGGLYEQGEIGSNEDEA